MQLLGNERASLCEGKGPSAKPEAQAASDVIGGPDAIAAGWVLVHAERRRSGAVAGNRALVSPMRPRSVACMQVLHATLLERYREILAATHGK